MVESQFSLAKASENLILKNFNENPQIVISIDPENKDLKALGEYVIGSMMDKGIALLLLMDSVALHTYCKVYIVDSAARIP